MTLNEVRTRLKERIDRMNETRGINDKAFATIKFTHKIVSGKPSVDYGWQVTLFRAGGNMGFIEGEGPTLAEAYADLIRKLNHTPVDEALAEASKVLEEADSSLIQRRLQPDQAQGCREKAKAEGVTL